MECLLVWKYFFLIFWKYESKADSPAGEAERTWGSAGGKAGGQGGCSPEGSRDGQNPWGASSPLPSQALTVRSVEGEGAEQTNRNGCVPWGRWKFIYLNMSCLGPSVLMQTDGRNTCFDCFSCWLFACLLWRGSPCFDKEPASPSPKTQQKPFLFTHKLLKYISPFLYPTHPDGDLL